MVIKICGLRRFEDIEYVNLCKPDYIGYIFAKSRRQIDLNKALELNKSLSDDIKKVGVFVNEKIERVVEIAVSASLEVVQIHGDEDSKYISELKDKLPESIRIWKAIRVKNIDSIKIMEQFDMIDTFVLDAFVENSYGGEGKTFDWNMASLAKKYGNIIIAGGLHEENIGVVIDKLKPFGLDVSSGVETDGFKDKNKVKSFILKAKEY